MSIADKLTQIAENERKVFEAGKKSEYDTFWDALQQNGDRTNYENGFQAWEGECFKPKYDIRITGAYSGSGLFRMAKRFDLKKMTIDKGINLDFSNATKLGATFDRSLVGEIPPLDLRSCTNMSMTFYAMYWDIEEFTTKALVLNNLREDCTFDRTFTGSKYLESIMITGTIGQDNLNVKDCTKLSKASITSIVNALSESTSGLSVTLSKTAVNNAFAETYKTYNVTIGKKQADGYYEVELPFDPIGDRYLVFSVPMDVEVNIGEMIPEEDIIYETTHYYGEYEQCVSYGVDYDVRIRIKRTDGMDLSPSDVYAVDREVLVNEWDELVYTKPNWTINLV